MHIREAVPMLRAAREMWHDETTMGTVFALVLVGVMLTIYYWQGQVTQESRNRATTGR